MRRYWTIAVVVSLSLVGCGKESAGPAATKEPAAPAASAATGKPATRGGPPSGVGAQPVIDTGGRGALTDDLVIGIDSRTCFMSAVPLTGAHNPLWRFNTIDGAMLRCGRPAVVASTVLVGYTTKSGGQGIEAETTETGVLGLGLDGKQRWKTPIKGVLDVVAAVERYAVVFGDVVYTGITHTVTVGVVDPGSGKVLWQKSGKDGNGYKVVGIDGDTVVVTQSPAGTSPIVTALDAATGAQRWTSPYTPLGNVGLAGGVVAVPSRGDKYDPLSSLGPVSLRDVKTGAVLGTEESANQSLTCRSDGRTTLVCQATGGRPQGDGIFAFDLASHQKTWTLTSELADQNKVVLNSVVDGRVFADTKTGGALLDAATGKQLVADLPAAPYVVRGAYGLARTANGSDQVYLITG